MNERIRELAEQADKWAGTEFHRLFLNNINANMKELFEEKFAELIVRECARVDSEENNPDHVDGETYNQTILQHFGVEE